METLRVMIVYGCLVLCYLVAFIIHLSSVKKFGREFKDFANYYEMYLVSIGLLLFRTTYNNYSHFLSVRATNYSVDILNGVFEIPTSVYYFMDTVPVWFIFYTFLGLIKLW